MKHQFKCGTSLAVAIALSSLAPEALADAPRAPLHGAAGATAGAGGAHDAGGEGQPAAA